MANILYIKNEPSLAFNFSFCLFELKWKYRTNIFFLYDLKLCPLCIYSEVYLHSYTVY